ncbi:MAG: hypothetical protein IJ358_03295 [Clostridia bacterium]|nr:hypothetical protein [Clostridia bacterium]
MKYNICEIYTWEKIEDIGSVVSEFDKVCKIMLDKGINKFRICTDNASTQLCREILNQYKF